MVLRRKLICLKRATFCNDGTKVSVRPSGTEPKIKFYLEVKDVMNTAAEYKLCEERAEKKIEAIKKSLRL